MKAAILAAGLATLGVSSLPIENQVRSRASNNKADLEPSKPVDAVALHWYGTDAQTFRRDASILAKLGGTDATGQVASVGNYGSPYGSNSVEPSAVSSRKAIRTTQDNEAGQWSGQTVRRAAQPIVDKCMGCSIRTSLDVLASGQKEKRDAKEIQTITAGNPDAKHERPAAAIGSNEPEVSDLDTQQSVRRAAHPIPECVGCWVGHIDVLDPGQKEQRGVDERRVANIGPFESVNGNWPRTEHVKRVERMENRGMNEVNEGGQSELDPHGADRGA